jgi:hypothetical protein
MTSQITARTRLQRARWLARSRVARNPLYLHLARFSDAQTDEWLIARHKALCIDGYPRSATTFAVAGFQLAQPEPVQVAHHSHAPAQVRAAARWGIPSLVTIREPEESVLSTAVYLPFLTVPSALGAYVAFYETVLPYRHTFVVGEFDDVTTRLGSVIRRVNEKFQTSFVEYEHSPENDRLVFDIIDQGDESSPTNELVTTYLSGGIGLDGLRADMSSGFGIELEAVGAEASVSTVARPSPERERMKAALRRSYRHPGLAGLRARADRAYGELTGRR